MRCESPIVLFIIAGKMRSYGGALAQGKTFYIDDIACPHRYTAVKCKTVCDNMIAINMHLRSKIHEFDFLRQRTPLPPITLKFNEPNQHNLTKWQRVSKNGEVIVSYQHAGCCNAYADNLNSKHIQTHLDRNEKIEKKWCHSVVNRYLSCLKKSNVGPIVLVSTECFINTFFVPNELPKNGIESLSIYEKYLNNLKGIKSHSYVSDDFGDEYKFILYAVGYKTSVYIYISNKSIRDELLYKIEKSPRSHYKNDSYATVLLSNDDKKLLIADAKKACDFLQTYKQTNIDFINVLLR